MRSGGLPHMSPGIMEHQRGPLDRRDLEVGVTEMFRQHSNPKVAPRSSPPRWLQAWESKRPRWLMEMLAEAFGTFFYCYAGEGASAALFVANHTQPGMNMGSLLTVAICVGFSIGLAIILTGPTSGGHLNPGLTISFAVFKGFPWRKVPQYIFAQLVGAFLGSLMVYVHFAPELNASARADDAAGINKFTPAGAPAAIAFFANPQRDIRVIFVNELMAATVLGTAIFGILDPTNAFISPTTGPIIISIMFVILISCFAVNGVSLNTARDLGSRFAMGAIYGRGAFQGSYCAIASLTNILGYLLGATFQTLVLSDTVRPPTAMAACNHQHQVQTEEAQLARKLENKNGGKSLGVTSTQSRRNSPPSDSSEKPIREIV